MCDGVTQGMPGMEIQPVLGAIQIAMSNRHRAFAGDVFDAALLLGVCDKIVPGLAHRGSPTSVICHASLCRLVP